FRPCDRWRRGVFSDLDVSPYKAIQHLFRATPWEIMTRIHQSSKMALESHTLVCPAKGLAGLLSVLARQHRGGEFLAGLQSGFASDLDRSGRSHYCPAHKAPFLGARSRFLKSRCAPKCGTQGCVSEDRRRQTLIRSIQPTNTRTPGM